MLVKKGYLMLMFLATTIGFTSCSDEDDNATPNIDPTGSLVVMDQEVDGTVTVSNIEMSDDGWVVVYNSTDTGVMGSEIIGSEFVEEGSYTDVMIDLEADASVQDGDVLWVALHTDDDDGIFDWDGLDGDDEFIMDGTMAVAESFTASVAGGDNSVTADDQAVSENTITLNNVTVAEGAWVVAYSDVDGEMGTQISEAVWLDAGTHDNVELTLTEDVAVGETVHIALHSDTGTEGEFDYDSEAGTDDFILDDEGAMVGTSFTITE